jgi:hypothetical protein
MALRIVCFVALAYGAFIVISSQFVFFSVMNPRLLLPSLVLLLPALLALLNKKAHL